MQDQVQYPESPFYSNHNVRKGISNNALNSLNYYAPKEFFLRHLHSLTVLQQPLTYKIISRSPTKETKQVRSKWNCGLLRKDGKIGVFTILHPSIWLEILQRIHTTHFLAHLSLMTTAVERQPKRNSWNSSEHVLQLIDQHTYLLTYLLTYSMVQCPS